MQPLTRSIPGWLLVLLAAIPTAPLPAQGGKQKTPPPGTIYFTHDGSTWSMNGDGGAKTRLPAGVSGEPSRLLHGSQRWFLQFQPVTGSYPDNTPRQELFAVRADGGASVQLTTQADLQPYPDSLNPARWRRDDGLVSWVAARWMGSAPAEPGLYAGAIRFNASGNVTGLDAQPAAPLVKGSWTTQSSTLRPDIRDHDWAPDHRRLVYATTSDTPSLRRLYIADTATSAAPVWLPTTRPAGQPEWSPLGTTIVFKAQEFMGDIYSIQWDGTGERRLIRTHGGQATYPMTPRWSANGQHIVYSLSGSVLADERSDTLRAAADGSGKTNLTSSLDTRSMSGSPAWPVGWR